MNPDKNAARTAHPVFAVERRLAIEMIGQHQLAVHEIIGMNAAGKAPPARQLLGEIIPGFGKPPGPVEAITIEVPGIGDIAGSFEGSDQTARRLLVA